MDSEGGIHRNTIKKDSWRTVMTLAYRSLGVVYGDLSTSPLYVYKSVFAEDIQKLSANEEIFGVLSFVFWTITLIPLIKYVFIILKADDNGEGGIFALYSKLCRNSRVGWFLPNSQVADEKISTYKKDSITCLPTFNAMVKATLEKHKVLQIVLLILALIGTSLAICDGVFSPAISVYSAISGLELSISKYHHRYIELPLACFILVCLFALQHYGTHRVGFLFAPAVITWLLCISGVGLYNIFYWNPQVYKALSPYYMYIFLKKSQRGRWMSLGGILLCIRGSEAMFADLGHFSQLSIKIAFTCFLYPSLVLAYMGQAAYLSKHHGKSFGFYVSVPDSIRWPVIVIAVLAAIVGSQAIITGTFSIIKQCNALNCFPRVKIVHTSSKIRGQVYIPEVNWILMVLCLAVTIGFRDTTFMANASGLAVITVMLITTILMSLVMVLCWYQSVFFAICFILFFGTIEALYFVASLIRFLDGAWASLALASVFFVIMYTWHYGSLKKYESDFHNKVPLDWLLGLGPSLDIVRVKGIGLVHTELVSGIPAVFSHFVTNVPAFHQTLVFICIKSIHIPYVLPEERFLVGRIGPKEFRIYRCIVRYGYHDIHKDSIEFEKQLVFSIAEFIRSGREEHTLGVEVLQNHDSRMTLVGISSAHTEGIQICEDEEEEEPLRVSSAPEIIELQSSIKKRELQPSMVPRKKRVTFVLPGSPRIMEKDTHEELAELMEAREAGMSFILGDSNVIAKRGSNCIKKLLINHVFDFLRRNSRSATNGLCIPSASTLEVRMVCHV
ncbi:hypothetical protein MKX01_039954 [Papaver californicum]|nr:hypothetical protein MKX01_039954 [Papaver californicum]